MAFDFRFPATDLDNASTLLDHVGSFWANIFTGSDLVQSLLYARAQLDAQAHAELLDLVASMSRLRIPVFHTDNWFVLTIRESERNKANLPAFDGTYTYADDFQIRFNTPIDTELSMWEAPSDLVSAPILFNRINDASKEWVYGIDFALVAGKIVFLDNPFKSDLVSIRDIFEGNVVVDREAQIWVYRGQFDRQNVYKQFGYVLSINRPSSERYKDFVNAIFDGIVQGTTQRAVEDALSAACDVPLVKNDGEVVTGILNDQRAQWVITDQNVYRYHLNDTVLVEVGDTVNAGQTLTTALRIYEFNRGQTPTAEQVRALAVGRGFTGAAYHQDLVFENKDVPLTVEEYDDGSYTKVSFDIKGWPGDVTKFWDDVHARGVAKGETLAMLLDRRTNKVGQPTAANLPASINPFGFLCTNVFRNHVTLIVVKTELFGPDALGLHVLRTLRKLIPPHTAMIVLSELEFAMDEIIMEGDAYDEEITFFDADERDDEIDPETMIEEDLIFTTIQGRCE